MKRTELEAMKVAELKKITKEHGLTLESKGHKFNKAELIERLVTLKDVTEETKTEEPVKEKVSVVEQLYGQSGLLNGVKGTAYTLIRVAARTNMDAVFAHYVGAMAESEDGNENSEEKQKEE